MEAKLKINTRLLIVGGAPRSGTTLLQNMLDSHPEILGGPEFMHLRDVIRLRGELRNSIREGWITAYADEGQLDEALRDFVTTLLERAQDGRRVEFFSEKSPTNVLVFEELLELFPGARFLLMVRNPRDVVASMLEVGERGRREGRTMQPFTRDAVSASNYVRRCAEAGLAARDAAPDRVRIVRYEELVTQPGEATREICDHLGLEWCAEMLRPGEKEHPGEDAIVDGVWYDEERFYSNPRADRIGSWRERLGPAEKIAVYRAFGQEPVFAAFGYDFGGYGLGFIARIHGYVCYGVSRTLQRLSRGIRSVAETLRDLGQRFTRSGTR